MKRHQLIAAPSYEVLSDDWHQVIPGGIDPVLHTNVRIVEPIPFREVPYPPRDSDFNDRPSFLQMVWSLWWPQRITWSADAPLHANQAAGPFANVEGTKTLIGEPYAGMPYGAQLALGLRSNIRSPEPFGQGDLSEAAQELYPTEE